MLAEERKKIILEELETHGKVQVVTMAERLQVSKETIRRDIDAIVKTENVRRVHGGAIKTSFPDVEPPYKHREDMNLEGKQSIGKEAALLINDGDTIFLDTGTTVQQLARFIIGKENLIIITNSLPTAMLLNESLAQNKFTGQLIMLGGEVSTNQKTISGNMCERMLEQFYVDKAFLSVGGISVERGISDYDLNESEISKIACSISKEVVVLADKSKIGIQSFSLITPLSAVDTIISDENPPTQWKKQLTLIGVNWKAVSI